MYQSYFPNSENEEDVTLFRRFTKYLQKTLSMKRMYYMKHLSEPFLNNNGQTKWSSDELEFISDLSASASFENLFVWDWVKCMLNNLSPLEREIFCYAYFMDMSDAKIASKVNLAQSTVWRYRHLAIDKMEKYIKREKNG